MILLCTILAIPASALFWLWYSNRTPSIKPPSIKPRREPTLIDKLNEQCLKRDG